MSPARIAVALWVCGFLAGCGTQMATPEAPQDVRLIRSLEGVDLFRQYCSSCHGLDAGGNGIMAPALKTQPPDLTVLARNNRGAFPAERVGKVLDGDAPFLSHGSHEMPIWGPIFHQVEADTDWGNVRMANLVEYLQSIQAGPDPSGAELYAKNCAACHGSDLQGTGPAPEPYRAPPDLTTLARRHGGEFPEAQVLDTLRNGVIIPEHGLADMPAWGTDSRLMDQGNPAQVARRIRQLVDYLKSKQAR